MRAHKHRKQAAAWLSARVRADEARAHDDGQPLPGVSMPNRPDEDSGTNLWIVNVSVASQRPLFAADTLECFFCCEAGGPFQLVGRYAWGEH